MPTLGRSEQRGAGRAAAASARAIARRPPVRAPCRAAARLCGRHVPVVTLRAARRIAARLGQHALAVGREYARLHARPELLALRDQTAPVLLAVPTQLGDDVAVAHQPPRQLVKDGAVGTRRRAEHAVTQPRMLKRERLARRQTSAHEVPVELGGKVRFQSRGHLAAGRKPPEDTRSRPQHGLLRRPAGAVALREWRDQLDPLLPGALSGRQRQLLDLPRLAPFRLNIGRCRVQPRRRLGGWSWPARRP
eukprot:6712296-Prymnesium_polylepis.1